MYGIVATVPVVTTSVVPANPRRHSITILGDSTFTLNFGSFAVRSFNAAGTGEVKVVLSYEELGDALYLSFTIVRNSLQNTGAVIETYTEERPVNE